MSSQALVRAVGLLRSFLLHGPAQFGLQSAATGAIHSLAPLSATELLSCVEALHA